MNNLHTNSRIPGSNTITLHLSALTVERLFGELQPAA
jgi:hypothetical protein